LIGRTPVSIKNLSRIAMLHVACIKPWMHPTLLSMRSNRFAAGAPYETSRMSVLRSKRLDTSRQL
jgi:hypothetical protein